MKTTIDMAREVKATAYTNRHYPDRTTYTFGPEQLEAFVDLVRAHACADEREACLSVIKPNATPMEIADAIRARSCPPCNSDCDQGRNCPARKDK